MSLVHYSRTDNIGIITVDNPPVHALSTAVRQGLSDTLKQAIADNGAEAVVLTTASRTFISGADIKEFGKGRTPPHLYDVINEYEASPKPVVAAIYGSALGGGFEITLGCHYRVAAAKARVGTPEIKLGLIPGAGATQRLPRLVGVETAVNMIVTGEPMPVEKAKELGVIDAIIDGDLTAGAVAFAKSVVNRTPKLPKVTERDDKLAAVRGKPEVFEKLRRGLGNRYRGQVAPLRGIEAVEAATRMPFAEGLRYEVDLFNQLMTTPQSKGSIRSFFAEREVNKIPDVPADTPTRNIARAAVIGAGTMGGGIAMCFANAGIPVTVVETASEALERGLGVVRKNYAGTVSKGRLSQEAMDKRMGLIHGALDIEAVREADIVIEAVFEEMDIKKQVFAKLDQLCKPGAILATNTSTLDVDEIARSTKRPADVIGTHFFSPANVMRLLEVVRGKETAKDVIATVMKLARPLGKVAVLVGVCDGFVGNRMLGRYLNQAEVMLEEGALPQQVDKVMFDFGMPMGPFAMHDLAGCDVSWRIRKRQEATRPRNQRVSNILTLLCERGRFGQKTGSGWYKYEPGARAPIPEQLVEDIIVAESKRLGIIRRTISDDEILKRCVYALINEGAKILEEGMALRPGDIDIIYIYGYGFPAWRGGPMCHADLVGLKSVYDDICRFAENDPEAWTPSPLLKRLVEQGKNFASLQTT
jgi:3-hydroxyacyl-CoA dehydrogenase